MLRIAALTFCGALSLVAVQATASAADDNASFLEQVSALLNKAQDRIEECVNRVKEHINSPEVQAKLEQIRAEHRAQLKEILLAVYPKLKEFRTKIAPLVEAKLQMKFMELHALMVDKLKILKAVAAERYEEELDKLIAKLPAEIQDKVRELRASPEYQAKRAEAAKKIEDYLVAHIHSAADSFSEDLKSFVDAKLDQLDARILAKIESL